MYSFLFSSNTLWTLFFITSLFFMKYWHNPWPKIHFLGHWMGGPVRGPTWKLNNYGEGRGLKGLPLAYLCGKIENHLIEACDVLRSKPFDRLILTKICMINEVPTKFRWSTKVGLVAIHRRWSCGLHWLDRSFDCPVHQVYYIFWKYIILSMIRGAIVGLVRYWPDPTPK